MKVHQDNEDGYNTSGMDIVRVVVELSNGEVLDLTPILEKPRRLRVTTVGSEWPAMDVVIACRAVPFEEFPAPFTQLRVTHTEKAVEG